MLLRIARLFCAKAKHTDQKGAESTMPVLAASKKHYKAVKAVEDILNKSGNLVVKRVGKDIVLIDDEHSHVLSGDKIQAIVEKIIGTSATTKISTSGLSKAQVEKLAGRFVHNSSDVEVYYVPQQRNSVSKLQRFEIVVKGGKSSG